jgi:pimeloyl-ACP methyl ester carboxylesterase
MPLPNPVILVPGITATDLRDLYDFPPQLIWSLTRNEYNRAGLHPQDTRYEGELPAQVRPDQVFDIAYKEMVLDLRHDLTERADQPVPVYIFGYDWRQPLEITQVQLGAFIDEVINKTALTRHYFADGYALRRKVNLVGHSMGGLVIAGYLAGQNAGSPVERVATIATPFKGSFQAVEKIVKGTMNRREREASRLTPALYHLLPSFTQGITIDPALPQTNMFDEHLWQSSVVDTINEALRLRGSGAPADPARILRDMLAQAGAHRKSVNDLDLATCGLTKADWLCIIGIGDKTQVAMEIQLRNGAPWFVLDAPGMTDKKPTRVWRTGDGTVPYSGALPNFLDEADTVVLSNKDFGPLEIKDKLLDAVTALHGILPNMNKLQTRLVQHLR